MIEIIPTNTCPRGLAELSRSSQAISELTSWVQLDIADGIFAPATSWPYGEGQMKELEDMKNLPLSETLQYEVHLMVQEPREVGCALAQAGAARIIGHVEVFDTAEKAHGALDAWRQSGAREAGLALLFDTPLALVEPLVPACDVVQLMSIATIGAQGAQYEPRVITKIQALRAQFPDVVISVDGGVSEKNIAELARAGARRFGVGSAISKASDPKIAYEHLKTLAENAIQ